MKQMLMETGGGRTELALVADGQLTDYRVFPQSGILPEQVYLARVDRIAKGIGAAFIRLKGGETGFLPFSETRTAAVSNGQALLVQVRKPPVGEKAAYLTEDISIAGRYAILLPKSEKRAVSSRITDENVRQTLAALSASLAPDGMGLILRRACMDTDPDRIRAEIRALERVWQQILQKGEKEKAPALLWDGRGPLERALEDWDIPDRLVANRKTDEAEGIPFVFSEHPFALCSVRQQRQKLLERRIWLPGGGFLVVDPCEAMTVIDVNTGKNTGKGADREALFLKTNLEAAQMIARLLRVRGIGGIVVIDFIDMESSSARNQVLSCLKTLALQDPVKCVVHGFTALGLVEMTRKKSDIQAADA